MYINLLLIGSAVIKLSKGYGYTRYFGEIPHSKPRATRESVGTHNYVPDAFQIYYF
jgi:hypothetical protein